MEVIYQVHPNGTRLARFSGSIEEYFQWRDELALGADWAIVAEFEALLISQTDPTELPEPTE